jgi:dolichyl-phosphate beta-glucosyltransferase
MSVVVPVYDEEKAIVGIVTALHSWLEESGRPYEILVVDNASQDRTVERLRPLLDGSRVRLLQNEANRGKGYSVRRGMLEASGAMRLQCDADCAPALASLTRMLDLIEDAHVVVGSRVAEGAQVGRTQPLRRRIVGWPFIALCRITLVEPTRDIFCGFKLWRGAAADAVYSRQSVEGWAFDAEVLALARRLGLRIRETGVVWSDREGSRLSIPQVLFSAVRELSAARRNVRRQTGGIRRTPEEATAVEPLVMDPAERRF